MPGQAGLDRHKDGPTIKGYIMRRFVILMLALGTLAGCETVEGLGQDISGGARKVRSAL